MSYLNILQVQGILMQNTVFWKLARFVSKKLHHGSENRKTIWNQQCHSKLACFIFSSSIMTPGYLHSGLKVQWHAWQGAAIPTAVKLSSERNPGGSPPLSPPANISLLSLFCFSTHLLLFFWSGFWALLMCVGVAQVCMHILYVPCEWSGMWLNVTR